MANTFTVTAPEGLPIVESVREFDFPVGALVRAHTEPELVKQWLGPRGYDMEIEEWDYVSGGRYRYIHHDPKGNDWAFHGVFHTVRDDFAIQTFEFEGVPDVVSLDSLRLEDLGDGRTRLSGHSIFPSVEARNGMVDSGTETGMREGYERLDELLSTL